LEAAAGLHKAAKRNRHLYEVLEALLSVWGRNEAP
jgi:hypothetical protein